MKDPWVNHILELQRKKNVLRTLDIRGLPGYPPMLGPGPMPWYDSLSQFERELRAKVFG